LLAFFGDFVNVRPHEERISTNERRDLYGLMASGIERCVIRRHFAEGTRAAMQNELDMWHVAIYVWCRSETKGVSS